MGVPNLAVVLICVLAAGAVVTVGAAFGRQFLPQRLGGTAGTGDAEGERDWTRMSPEQEAYCRSVREANQMALFAQMRQQKHPADYETQAGYVSHAVSERSGYRHAAYSNEHLPQQHMPQQYPPPPHNWEDVDGR